MVIEAQQDQHADVKQEGKAGKLRHAALLPFGAGGFATPQEEDAHEHKAEGIEGDEQAVVVAHQAAVDQEGHGAGGGDGGGELIEPGAGHQPADLLVALQNADIVLEGGGLFAHAPELRAILLGNGGHRHRGVDRGENDDKGHHDVVKLGPIGRAPEGLQHAVHLVLDGALGADGLVGQHAAGHDVDEHNGADHADHVPDHELAALLRVIGQAGLPRLGAGALGGVADDIDDVADDVHDPAERPHAVRQAAEEDHHQQQRQGEQAVSDDHEGAELPEAGLRSVHQGAADRVGDAVEHAHQRREEAVEGADRQNDGGAGYRPAQGGGGGAGQVHDRVVGEIGVKGEIDVGRGVIEGKQRDLPLFGAVDGLCAFHAFVLLYLISKERKSAGPSPRYSKKSG